MTMQNIYTVVEASLCLYSCYVYDLIYLSRKRSVVYQKLQGYVVSPQYYMKILGTRKSTWLKWSRMMPMPCLQI